MKEQLKETPTLSVTVDDLIPYINKKGEVLAKQVRDAKQKYGARYNDKNRIEEMYRRFGDPQNDPEKFAKEYMLILQKKSNLPATVRYPVRELCDAAMNECYYDKIVANATAQNEAEKPKSDEQ